jgi:hypothetical protein
MNQPFTLAKLKTKNSKVKSYWRFSVARSEEEKS